MGSEKGVRFLSSITTKITIILILAFTAIITLVFYTVNLEGFDEVRSESDKLVIQNGENTVNLMSANLAGAMRSAVQLRDTSEIVPNEPIAFERALNQVFNENSYKLLGSGGIWPDAYKLNADIQSAPMVRVRETKGYTKENMKGINLEYLDTPWFNMVKDIEPTSCIWNHITLTLADKGFSMRCALAINRDNEFWGATSVNFTLDSIQMAIDSLNSQLGSGYAILIDNSNQIIASTSPKRLPYIDKTTGEMMMLNEFAQIHPEWQSIETLITQERKQTIANMVKKLPRTTVNQLNAYDDVQGRPEGSMLINAAAALQKDNPQVLTPHHAYMRSHTFIDDRLPNSSGTAYLFEVPETLWKLVIIKPTYEVNTVADNLSKSVIRYLIFALLITAASAFLLLDTLVLRPLQKTTKQAITARKLLEAHQYDTLSTVKFEEARQDEIGFVNTTLNELLKHIQYTEAELDEANQRLEMGEDNYIAQFKKRLEPKEFDHQELQSELSHHKFSNDKDSSSIKAYTINSHTVNSQSIDKSKDAIKTKLTNRLKRWAKHLRQRLIK